MQPSPNNPQDLTSVLDRLLRIGFGLGGLISLAVGIWMFLSPLNWYTNFPAAVTDFGPANAHLVRDLGGWYMAGGVLLLFALTNPMRFGGVALLSTLVTIVFHAATHIMDLVSGRVGPKHWVIDAPFVFVPVLIYVLLLWVWWNLQTGRHPELNRPDSPDE